MLHELAIQAHRLKLTLTQLLSERIINLIDQQVSNLISIEILFDMQKKQQQTDMRRNFEKQDIRAQYSQAKIIQQHNDKKNDEDRPSKHYRNSEEQQEIHQNVQNYIDMNKFNPDWRFAELHGKSTCPGFSDERQNEKCICCLNKINNGLVPLCSNSKQLQFLGYGFPLFYIFIKYVMILLLIQILNYQIMELSLAIDGNYDFCAKKQGKTLYDEKIFCTSFMVFMASVSDYLQAIEVILRITSFLSLLVCLIYMRDIFTKTWKYYEEKNITYSKFSVLLEGLPPKPKSEIAEHTITIGQRLRNFFSDEQIFPNRPHISQINLLGELQKFIQLEQKVKETVDQMGPINQQIHQLKKEADEGEREQREKLQFEISILQNDKAQLKQKQDQIKKQIKDEKERLKSLIYREDLDCEKAIICFTIEDDRIQVQKSFSQITPQQFQKHFTQNIKQINLNKAPQPQQIFWKHINVLESVRIRRRLISQTIFILLLAILTVGVYFLFNYISHQALDLQQKLKTNLIKFSYVIGIIFFNKFILAFIIHHLVEFQMHKTGETFQFSLMLKYALGLFFTTAVITLFAEGIVNQNVYEQEYGIAEEETIMFFMTTFLVPLIWLVNPWYLLKLISRKRFQGSPFMTQDKANKLMENPQYLMGKRYGQILQSIWFTFLYSCLLPFGSILIFIWLALYYWVDKYNLLRRSSILQGVSGDLCMKALFLLEFTLVLKPAGEMIFDNLLKQQVNIFSIIQLVIGCVYLALPMGKILNYFHHQKFLSSKMTFDQFIQNECRGYEMFNPLTKENELRKHFQQIQKSQKQNKVQLPNNPDNEESKIWLISAKNCFIRPHSSEKIKEENNALSIEKVEDNFYSSKKSFIKEGNN